MIEFVTGDFFEYKADIRINTVNCVGVMGAGVALEFKTRYPEMFKAYVEICKRNEIEPGKPFLWEEYDLFSQCLIINLPTKLHWKNPSEYEYIEKDLIWLRSFLIDKGEDIIVTLPALGCGHGGLNWNIVKDKICHYLEDIKVKVLVFEPASSNKSFSNFPYNISLKGKDIETVFKTDKEYPIALNNLINQEIYCKGNKNILQKKIISLICSSLITEKEQSAVTRTLQEFQNSDYALIIGLNNKKHLEFSKKLLEQGYSLILIIPYGILHYKYDKELGEYESKCVVVSYLAPNQEFKRYEYINSLKLRLTIADVNLYCSENRDDIKRDTRYLKGFSNLFYINYWTDNVEEFICLQAKKIGINPETRKPNITNMKYYLDNANKG